MLSLALLVFTLCLSALVVQIGAIALELTGIPAERARFQALSAFTGVGYATREAEAIMAHPQRRRIISLLIRLGSAGIVTSVGTLASTLVSTPRIFESFASKDYVSILPLNAAQLCFLLLTMLLATLTCLLRKPEVARLIRELIAAWLLIEHFVTEETHEEVLINADEHAVVRIEITAASPLRDMRLVELNLEQCGVLVLAVQQLTASTNFPAPSTRLRQGDSLLLYGDLPTIKAACLLDPVRTRLSRRNKQSSDQPLDLLGTAPDFTLHDQNGEAFSLSRACKQSVVILLFYPKDRSFFCSRMLSSFAKVQAELGPLGVQVVAINPASIKSHRNFCDALGAEFPVLSDPKKAVCRSYRALMLSGMLVNRCVYVIDRNQRIVYAKRGLPPLNEVVAAACRTTREVLLPQIAARPDRQRVDQQNKQIVAC